MALIHIEHLHLVDNTTAVLAAIADLKGTIMAQNAETVAALNTIKANLVEVGTEFESKLTELTDALKGTTSPEADALIAELVTMSRGLADKVT